MFAFLLTCFREIAAVANQNGPISKMNPKAEVIFCLDQEELARFPSKFQDMPFDYKILR